MTCPDCRGGRHPFPELTRRIPHAFKRESDESVSEAEAQQRAIIEEEKRSAEGLEHGQERSPELDPPVPNGYLPLVAKGLELTAALGEIRAATRQIRAAAQAACLDASIVRAQSAPLRHMCQNRESTPRS